MDKSEKFIGFLDNLKDSSNESLIEAVKEAFVLTEATVRGINFPDPVKPEMRRMKGAGKPQSQEEINANTARLKREQSTGKQAGGRASGSMAQIAKYAMTAPMDVEKWMNEVLKPAIKAGKKDMDSRFGTDSAKVGFGQRLKNVGKAFMGENAEVDMDYEDDFDDEDENEEEIGGFKSNREQSLNAKNRRQALKEATEVDYDDKEPFDNDYTEEDEEDENEVGGFKSNKLQKREANMRRGSLKA